MRFCCSELECEKSKWILTLLTGEPTEGIEEEKAHSCCKVEHKHTASKNPGFYPKNMLLVGGVFFFSPYKVRGLR